MFCQERFARSPTRIKNLTICFWWTSKLKIPELGYEHTLLWELCFYFTLVKITFSEIWKTKYFPESDLIGGEMKTFVGMTHIRNSLFMLEIWHGKKGRLNARWSQAMAVGRSNLFHFVLCCVPFQVHLNADAFSFIQLSLGLCSLEHSRWWHVVSKLEI